MMRLGWFRPAHCKSMAAHEMRALLTARKLVQSKLLDLQMSLRGLLRATSTARSAAMTRTPRRRSRRFGAGAKKRTELQLDHTGWHGPKNLKPSPTASASFSSMPIGILRRTARGIAGFVDIGRIDHQPEAPPPADVATRF